MTVVCVSCGVKGQNDKVKFYEIQSEAGSYHCCVPCLARATDKLQKMKRRTFEETALLTQLKKVVGTKVLHT